MKPYYEDPCGITIYHGDCREILPTLADGRVDLVLTDPPYGMSYVTNRRKRNDVLRAGIVGDDSLDVLADACSDIYRILGDNRHWYVFASPMKIPQVMRVLNGMGDAKHVLAWDKGNRGTVGDLEAGFGEAWEAIIYGMKGRRELFGSRPRTILRYDWSGALDPVHPTVKPVGLLQRLMYMSSLAGESILDPFMGSGTTLRAAKDLGRKAIGIEIEERYCEIAAKRLRQEVLPLAGVM